MEVSMTWQGGLKFSGESLFGLPIATDGSRQAGGSEDGYKPTELVFFALAGCTGIDLVVIAKKMQQEVTGLTIKVNAEQREDYPMAFTRAHIIYTFTGRNLNKSKLEQAIMLSEEKYCSVGATLAGIMKITHSCIIKEG